MSGTSEELIQKIYEEITEIKEQVKEIPKLKSEITEIKEQVKEIPKLKSEITEIKEQVKEIPKLKSEITEIKEQVEENTQELRNISGAVARIEVEHGEKLVALFDAFKVNSEKIEKQNQEIIKCKKILEKHDNQIYILNSKIQNE